MGRGLQKRKRRSSRQAVRQPSSNKPLKRLQNPLGNDIIARNWNKDETTTQNYRRLGLVARLRAPTGGAEPDYLASANSEETSHNGRKIKRIAGDPFSIHHPPTSGAIPHGIVTEARVERDAEGRIVRVIRGNGSRKANPLNDPLNEFESGSDSDSQLPGNKEDVEEWDGIGEGETGAQAPTEVVRALEREANRPVVKRVRTQSSRERDWLQALVDKHGNDTEAMFRDRKLNPMQQTQADIARRLKKLRKGGSL